MVDSTTQLKTSITLSNGLVMPTIGLGTYQLSNPDVHVEVMYKAIVESGYRFLDCATMYKNEELVGQAI